ncbi:hypothetical protein, partial [Haliscomenobacter sp.]|uniref:hypothetical protein n=1 Tax=Haliscomenobacter sp. TaxID=2717303 RepID=UPI003592F2A4
MNHLQFSSYHQSDIFKHKEHKGSTKNTKLDVDGLCALWCATRRAVNIMQKKPSGWKSHTSQDADQLEAVVIVLEETKVQKLMT